MSKLPKGKQQAEWFSQILSWSPDELIQWTAREGDEEDKMIFLDVFLWRQRHGIIDRKKRINHAFLEESYAWYVHRYMIANGYDNILTTPPSRRDEVSYLEQIESLLDLFDNRRFRSDEFWSLIVLLNVLGPQLEKYKRRDEVLKIAEYIVTNFKSDARLETFTNDNEFAGWALLVFDLKMHADQTWPVFKEIFLSSPKHSVTCYPALIVGLEMYGSLFRKEMDKIEIQGGNDLFFKLLEKG